MKRFSCAANVHDMFVPRNALVTSSHELPSDTIFAEISLDVFHISYHKPRRSWKISSHDTREHISSFGLVFIHSLLGFAYSDSFSSEWRRIFPSYHLLCVLLRACKAMHHYPFTSDRILCTIPTYYILLVMHIIPLMQSWM